MLKGNFQICNIFPLNKFFSPNFNYKWAFQEHILMVCLWTGCCRLRVYIKELERKTFYFDPNPCVCLCVSNEKSLRNKWKKCIFHIYRKEKIHCCWTFHVFRVVFFWLIHVVIIMIQKIKRKIPWIKKFKIWKSLKTLIKIIVKFSENSMELKKCIIFVCRKGHELCFFFGIKSVCALCGWKWIKNREKHLYNLAIWQKRCFFGVIFLWKFVAKVSWNRLDNFW
jgi:hypothetical protein